MDEGNRLPPSHGRASVCFPWSTDTFAEFTHSTPVKNDVSKPPAFTSFKVASLPNPAACLCPPSVQGTDFPVNDLSGSTVQRQRRELQLLMAELKDRDRELNTMVAAHQKQFHAWEQDRQRVLTLEQKCARLNEELQKRNEVIRVLTKRAWVVETREEEVQKELSVARQQLSELQQEQQHISQKFEDFEEKNQSLNSTVMALSSQVGSLQVREEELSSMLKLKDKDVTEASGHIADLTGRLQELETSLTESRSRENKLLKDLEENKRRYREAKHGITHLKEELQQQLTQGSTQREEIIRLKQELQLLRRDLVLSGEGGSWKDELLELARSKQERTMSELRCLRQVCENQQNDLQLLQLNLESAHETLREKSSPGLGGSQDELKCGCLDKRSPSSLGVKNSRLLSAAAKVQGTIHGDLGGFSGHLMDGDVPLSSNSLQQILEESRQVITASSERNNSTHLSSVLNSCPTLSSVTADQLHSHKCQSSHHCPASLTQKAIETPPKACPRHQTDLWKA